MHVLICFYSLYGQVHNLAKEIAKGVEAAGAVPMLRFVQETLPADVLQKMGAASAEARGANLPVATPDDLAACGAAIFGSPTRFGGMCAQMRTFLDRTGGLWAKNSLQGKVGSAFTSSNTQHGGQEITLFSFHSFMLHHGMLIAGAPFSNPALSSVSDISGGTPYGASTIAGPQGERSVTANEADIARWQGEFVASVALKLAK